MGEENTDGKLSTQLAQETQGETCTKEKLRFTDYAIERHQSNFIDPKTNKTKDRVYTPLNLNKNSALKGLRLVQYYTTRKKYFQLNYWYNGKSKPLTLGEFIPGKFGTREVQEKIFRIYKICILFHL